MSGLAWRESQVGIETSESRRGLNFSKRTAKAVNLLRFDSIPAGRENFRQGQTPPAIGQQRQQKRADKLRVRFPNRIAGIAEFKRQRVNEDRFAAAKQNVARGGVLQPESIRERGLGEFERQTAGRPKHFGRPFVRITGKRNPLVLKDRAPGLRVENRLQLRRFAKRGGFIFVQTPGGNKFFPGHELARAIGLQEFFEFRNGLRGDKAQHTAMEGTTTTRRIAKRWRGCGHHLGSISTSTLAGGISMPAPGGFWPRPNIFRNTFTIHRRDFFR